MKKPLLSIGMIFKNEIRCLERCMKSLQPLRDAIPCELVMADTGSDDGSREIAEKYADILFDFPWINDFAAARNAVMDQCSGIWYMSIDADEWLDKDISELVTFLKADRPFDWASLRIFNYETPELENGGQYADFVAMRLARMATGIRYEGVIHEYWNVENAPSQVTHLLLKTILHHDGYLDVNKDFALAKANRNMELLKVKLAQDPTNLRTLLQCAECAAGEESLRYVRQALETDAQRSEQWQNFGPPLLRRAVQAANEAGLQEAESWIERAVEEFPDSIFIRVDVACCAYSHYLQKKEYSRCIHYGQMYLNGVKDYQTNPSIHAELQYGVVSFCSSSWERKLRTYLADTYQRMGQTDAAINMLSTLDVTVFNGEEISNFVKALRYIHSSSNADTAPILERIWHRINSVDDTDKQLKNTFIQTSAEVFSASYRQSEREREIFCRPAYTVFLPLVGRCEVGTAAAMLEAEDRAEMEKLLDMVGNWDEFPISALEHALLGGAQFPCPTKPLNLETMDSLATRMARPDGPLTELAVLAAAGAMTDWQSLAWARGLALAVVKSCGWTDGEQGMTLCRAFAKIECAFLPRYYAAELLCEENIQVLPPMHRFGWYCAQAFQTLDAGDSAGYVRLLRKGLEVCPEMKGMVEFLLKQLEESCRIQATPELLALAEQVRVLLAQYPADDPAVEALKQSAAYQKVAHLIEGPEPGMFGGLKQ